MHFANPFTQPGTWYKGSLHIHSTASDGERTPQEVIAWYRDRGYHFVAFTDHMVLARGQQLDDGFVVLGGIEVHGTDPQSGDYHIVGLGLNAPPDLLGWPHTPLQGAIDGLRAVGALVALAHPYWTGQMSRDLVPLQGAFALEVYNGGCEVDDARGISAVHWDDLLAAGQRLWGLAVDDVHWRSGDHDAGLGWVWVKAAELNEAAILQALEQGYFYASCGPRLLNLEFDPEQGLVRVLCSPAVHIDFVGNGPCSRRIAAPPGETLSEAVHRVDAWQRYVRVACQDSQGRWAWSNPIFLDQGA